MTTATETQQAPAPAVLSGVAPYLSVDGAVKASDFYQKALGAKELMRHPVDDQGRTMHIHLNINGASVMLADFYPEHGGGKVEPAAVTLHLQVEGVDGWWKRAVDGGFEIVLPLQDMFWGDRYGQLRDPFGHMWSMGETPKA